MPDPTQALQVSTDDFPLININGHRPVHHDLSIIFAPAIPKIIVQTPNFWILVDPRHLPTVNVITGVKVTNGTELSTSAHAELFHIQQLMFSVFAELTGVRPKHVQMAQLGMSSDDFHVQYWGRFDTPFTLLGRKMLDIDLSPQRKQFMTRSIKGEVHAQMVEDAEFIAKNATEIHAQLRAAFIKHAGLYKSGGH